MPSCADVYRFSCFSKDSDRLECLPDSTRSNQSINAVTRLHSADEDAVSWLTNYGSWHAYEKKTDGVAQLSNSLLECLGVYGGPYVSHCRILSPDKTEWRLVSATLCGWRYCFVADQLWFMTCIQKKTDGVAQLSNSLLECLGVYGGPYVSHCRILSPDKTEWRLVSATLCGWRRCFVADQLWLMARIREEDCQCPLKG